MIKIENRDSLVEENNNKHNRQHSVRWHKLHNPGRNECIWLSKKSVWIEKYKMFISFWYQNMPMYELLCIHLEKAWIKYENMQKVVGSYMLTVELYSISGQLVNFLGVIGIGFYSNATKTSLHQKRFTVWNRVNKEI